MRLEEDMEQMCDKRRVNARLKPRGIAIYGSSAFGIAAGHAGVAAFELDEARGRAARTGAHRSALGSGFGGCRTLGIVLVRLGLGQEPDQHEMALDYLANRGKERGNVAPAHPLPT